MPPAALLALLLAATLIYAAGASGAIVLPPAARAEAALAALGLFAVAAVLFAPGVRVSTSAAGWAGLGLLLAFAIWTGVSLSWSIEPDGTWVQLNRALAYVAAAAVALVVGASLPQAARRVALGYLVIATAVALYALGGKAVPWVHIHGLIDLNHTAFFSRLRAPLAYWNALALFCVLAVPVALHAAIEPLQGRRQQALATGSLVLLLTTIGLTYSRGGVAAAAVALAVVLLLGPDRLQLAAAAAAGLAGAVPALVLGFTLNALTRDEVPLHDRTGDGLLFTLALIAGLALAVVLARVLIARTLHARPPRVPARAAVAAAVVVVVAAFAIAVAGGSVSQGFESFKSVKFERQDDPARILQTNSGNRWVWWNEALGAWSDKPLAGWGAGSFPLLHLRYRHNRLEVLQPHSVPLEWLAEVGLVGALLALGALGALAVAGAQRVAASARGRDPGVLAGPEQRYGAALAAGAAAWLVHMWFDWDWDIPGVTLPLMVFLGVLAARPLGRPGLALGAGRSPLGARSVALALATVIACGIAVSAVLPSLGRDHLEAARAAAAANDLQRARDEADTAARLDPLGVDSLLLSARVAGRQAQFAGAATALRKALRRQPDNPDVWYGVARFDLARGDVPALLQASRTMLRLDPVGSLGRFFYYAADFGVRSATATGTPLPP